MRARFSIWILAGLLGAFSGYAQPATKTFRDSAHGFTLVLPADWDKLPAEQMKTMNDTAAKVRPDWPRPVIHGGYQVTNETGYVLPAKFLIRVADIGHPFSEAEVRAEWRDRTLVPEEFQINDPVLDTNLNAFVATGVVDFTNATPLNTLMAVFPTRTGGIKIVGYAARKDVEEKPTLLSQILTGVRIDEQNKVGWKPSPAGLFAGLGAILVIAVVLWKARPAESSAL